MKQTVSKPEQVEMKTRNVWRYLEDRKQIQRVKQPNFQQSELLSCLRQHSKTLHINLEYRITRTNVRSEVSIH